jgi:putative two-component system response regulator
VRTQAFVRLLCDVLVDHPRFCDALAGPRADMIVKAAPLHDIGRVGIPDAVLLKPGRLTPDEMAVMKTHATIGGDAIRRAMDQALAGVDDDAAEMAVGAFALLQSAHEIAIGHHEKWDGSGYPLGLAGDAIPVSARLMALADVFDALTTRRTYKAAMPVEEAERILLAGSGTHFDPDVVDAYLAVRDEFARVARELADEGA